jgi:hypothetical protein
MKVIFAISNKKKKNFRIRRGKRTRRAEKRMCERESPKESLSLQAREIKRDECANAYQINLAVLTICHIFAANYQNRSFIR